MTSKSRLPTYKEYHYILQAYCIIRFLPSLRAQDMKITIVIVSFSWLVPSNLKASSVQFLAWSELPLGNTPYTPHG